MRTITIKSGCLGRYDDVSPFLVEAGGLELKIVLPNKSGEFFLVTELNGRTEKHLIPADGIVKLGKLEAGELHAEVKHYLRGTLIEAYKIEPLLLKAVDGSISATPEFVYLKREIEGLRKEFDDHLMKVYSLIGKDLHARDCAQLAFAWAVYQSSVQLNGKELDLEDFIITLGYDITSFTEDELEEIKKKKEEL